MAAGRHHWFEPLAEHMGPAYLRYSFTKGTDQEVGFLVDHLELGAGARVLDVGCGPGRHAHALARQGLDVTGLDIADRFVRTAAAGPGTYVRGDARCLPFTARFDAVISLCQGGFGLTGGPASDRSSATVEPDEVVLAEIARVLAPGGVLALTAFSAYFCVRFLEDSDTFDAVSGVNHEDTEVRDEAGVALDADLWTTCYTPRELRLLVRSVGLDLEAVHAVRPGDYATRTADLDHPEFLVIARRPR